MKPNPCAALVFVAAWTMVVPFSATQAEQAPQGARPSPSASSPSEQVRRLLRAYESADFRQIFDSSYLYQSALERIPARLPQEPRQRQEDALYATGLKEFKEQPDTLELALLGSLLDAGLAHAEGTPGLVDPPANGRLRNIMRSHPKWEILQEQELPPWPDAVTGITNHFVMVYVRLKYPDEADAALSDGGLVNEVTAGFRLVEGRNLYYSIEIVAESHKFFPLAKPRLLSAQWISARQGEFFVGFNVVGGRPPYTSETRCAGIVVERMDGSEVTPDPGFVFGSPLQLKRSMINILVPSDLPVSFPVECHVTVKDQDHRLDKAKFTVPKMYPGQNQAYCFVREPWRGWGQGTPLPRAGYMEAMPLD
jgi:hypothetical protein